MQRARPDGCLQLGRRALRDDLAVVDDGDAVCELVGLLEVLRAEQDRRALGDERADDVPDLVARARIQAGRRLVEEHELRGDDDARGDVQSAAHAAGVVLDELAGGLGQPERVEQLVGAALRGPAFEPEQQPEQDEVLAAGEVLVDGCELAGEAHEPADRVGVGDDVVSEHARAARVGADERREHPDRRRLAGAVGSEHAVDGPAAHAQVDAVDGAGVAEGLREARGLDRERGLRCQDRLLRSGRSIVAHLKRPDRTGSRTRTRASPGLAPGHSPCQRSLRPLP